MKKDIILAGVGGQGILSIAYVVDNAALDAGLHFKQAEVHGMAQRGGAVQSHLRLGDGEIHSDLVPEGRADLILSVEPLEALRYLEFLAPDGVVVSSLTPFSNIADYPAVEALHARLLALPRVVLVDSGALARECGTPRAQNMVMIGAAVPYLGLTEERLALYVRRLFERKGERVVAQNLAAFAAGRAAGALFTACLGAGLDHGDAVILALHVAADGIDPATAPLWCEAFAGPGGGRLRAALVAMDGKQRVRSDRATAERVLRDGI